ncbi:biotin--[acetyl-CoA-carboxylase] ligase [Anaerococcus urinomassiliensis]|uniref:biotin--[acetyl-CoA-carboxylase] ligase n=1 Tax=Anaerococcus urinomassiliensis TaxID=1745712 RepID=UPI00093FC231|nr:biotin--[acetyl-CoA-carboxylase] ligase [Anaerococcus urinomassiliensis]
MSQIFDNNMIYLLRSNEINKALDLVIGKDDLDQLNNKKILTAKLMMLLGQKDRFDQYIKKEKISSYFSKSPTTYMYHYMYYTLIEDDQEKRADFLDKFDQSIDLLSKDKQEIENLLKDLTDKKASWLGKEVHLESVDSTNTYIKDKLNKGEDISIVTADEQVRGKGQKDRAFVSPKGGLYISLNISVPDSDLILVTSQTGVLLAKALKKMSNKDIKIKWLNDLYIGNKKLAGILCESAVDHKGHAQYTIVGIGINLIELSPIPEDLRPIMTTLFGKDSKLTLSDTIENVKYYLIPAILSMQEGICQSKLLENYNELMAKKGDEVIVYSKDEEIAGTLIGMDDKLDLILEVGNEEKTFSYDKYRLKFIG